MAPDYPPPRDREEQRSADTPDADVKGAASVKSDSHSRKATRAEVRRLADRVDELETRLERIERFLAERTN